MSDITPTSTEEERMDALIADISTMTFEEKEATDQNLLLKFLNKAPHPSWVRERNGVKYIPIGIIEALMQRVFQRYRVEVKNHSLLANSITVCVRVHYYNPATKEWEWQDGVWAVPLQIKNPDKRDDISAIDFAQMQTLSVQMGLPSAESYAIKDACEKIGKLFWRDIARKDANTMAYSDIFKPPVSLEWFSTLPPKE